MPIELSAEFSTLTTPLVADGCLRADVPLRLAPPNLRAIPEGARVAGRVLPAKHQGSVDVFLEAFEACEAGDVLVVDNAGRLDEACLGDLTTLEAQAAGVAGAVVWGLVRDTAELQSIGLPIFCYGTLSTGPTRAPARPLDRLMAAHFGQVIASRDDAVFADSDGALFVALEKVPSVLAAAREIAHRERRQAEAMRTGKSLRSQVRFREYLEKSAKDPEYTFRKHLRTLDGAIEE